MLSVFLLSSNLLFLRGHGFRSDFLKVPEVRSILEKGTPILCLTGTASKRMVVELAQAFTVNFEVVSLSPDR